MRLVLQVQYGLKRQAAPGAPVPAPDRNGPTAKDADPIELTRAAD